MLELAIEQARYQLITEIEKDFDHVSSDVVVVQDVDTSSTVIDIRHPDDMKISPLNSIRHKEGTDILTIPFYQLRTKFTKLDSTKRYLLYCDKGMMSRLHAAHLQDEGFTNVAVLDLFNKHRP